MRDQKKGVCGFQNHGRWARVAKESIGYLSRKKNRIKLKFTYVPLNLISFKRKKKRYNRYYILFSTQKSRFVFGN